ncbi:MAG: hypothetical protein ABJG78_21235 [Cyclobacteriaceae bacterium]
MKKVIIFIFLAAIFAASTQAQIKSELVDTTKYYAFHLNYWFNMHHLLWVESFMNEKADSTIMTIKLAKSDRAKLDATLDYYKEKLLSEDLRFSDYMQSFKKWITEDGSNLTSVPKKYKEHIEVLKEFDPIYQKYFWATHKEACESILNNHLALIKNTEEEFVERITTLTRQYWQFETEKIRVDLSYFGKSTTRSFGINPYTTLFPTHVVMSAFKQDRAKGSWLELLYHESAHHLILENSYFVAGTIKDLAQVEKFKIPRQLSHSYLFFFTGQITKELLEEQGIDYPQIYMDREKVFYNYFPLLQKHLTPYMNREVTLTEATRRFIADFND